jgi:hypothetical protein
MTMTSKAAERAVKRFIEDCPSLGLTATWAALGTRDIRSLESEHRFLRQIRKVQNVLAVAQEPMLGNLVVLTTSGFILNLTPTEYATL